MNSNKSNSYLNSNFSNSYMIKVIVVWKLMIVIVIIVKHILTCRFLVLKLECLISN